MQMHADKILRYAILTGIFLVPFIALIVSDKMFFPFITGKNFGFRILVELLLGGWLILALRDSTYRLKSSWLFITIAAFVGIIAIADAFSIHAFKSFWSNFERMEGFITLAHLLAYFVVAGSMLNTEKLWNRFFNVSVFVSIIISIYGLLQLAGKVTINQGGVRLDATLGNATYFAIYIIFHIFITAFLFLKWRGAQFMKWIYLAVIALQIFVLYHTATRGAIIGFIGGALLATILIAIFERERKNIRKVSIGIIIALLVVVGGFLAIKNTDFVNNSKVLNRFAQISIEEQSSSRFIVWSMAWQGIKERPILGWGQESFNVVFNKYYDPSMYSQEPWFDRVHNIIFDWLIAGGFFGLIAYLSIFIAVLYYLWRKDSSFSVAEKSLVTGLLAAYFFHNMFVFDNITSYIVFFSVLSYIHFRGVESKSDTPEEIHKIFSHGTVRIVASLIIIVTIFSLYALNGKGILTARGLLSALRPYQEGVTKNLEWYEKTLTYNSIGGQEVKEQLLMAASTVGRGDYDIDIKQKFFDLARGEMQKQIDRQPNDARLQVFMGSFLNTFGAHDDSLVYLNKARSLSPNKQAILFELGNSYLLNGKFEKALEVFKEAYELEKNFGQARRIYAIGAIYAGRNDIVEELLVPVYGTTIISDDRIVQAYFDTGQFDKVLAIWQLRVKNEPENPQYRVSLAATYLKIGNRISAISELEKAIELNPEFKEQGEFLINEIRAGRNP